MNREVYFLIRKEVKISIMAIIKSTLRFEQEPRIETERWQIARYHSPFSLEEKGTHVNIYV